MPWRTVVVCCPTVPVGERLKSVLEPEARVIECVTKDDLVGVSSTLRPRVAVCELATDVPSSWEAVDFVRQIVRGAMGIHLVVVCQLGKHAGAAITAALRAGAEVAVLYPYEDVAAPVRRALGGYEVNATVGRLQVQMRDRLSAKGERIVFCCMRLAHRQPTVELVAETLGICRRTLERQCRASELPLPENLIGWCRLMMVMELSRSGHGSVDDLSKRFGFQGAADMRTKLKRRTGLTVRGVRMRGGLAELFLQHISAQRGVTASSDQRRLHLDDGLERAAPRQPGL